MKYVEICETLYLIVSFRLSRKEKKTISCNLWTTSATISTDTTPVSSRNSLTAADFGSSPFSIPPYHNKNKDMDQIRFPLSNIIDLSQVKNTTKLYGKEVYY